MPLTTSSNLLAAMVKDQGVPIREEENKSRLELFERKLPKRLPQSFASILSRYSFPAFDAVGISLFGWILTEAERNAKAVLADIKSRRAAAESKESVFGGLDET